MSYYLRYKFSQYQDRFRDNRPTKISKHISYLSTASKTLDLIVTKRKSNVDETYEVLSAIYFESKTNKVLLINKVTSLVDFDVEA